MVLEFMHSPGSRHRSVSGVISYRLKSVGSGIKVSLSHVACRQVVQGHPSRPGRRSLSGV